MRHCTVSLWKTWDTCAVSRGRLALLLAALSFAIYVPSLSGDFLVDDVDYVLSNQALLEPGLLKRSFSDPSTLTASPSQARMMYRPLTALSFGVNRRLGGDNVFWFHLVSVLLHAGNVCLVYLLSGSAAGAAVFALHPAQVESVAYISGSRATLLSFFFCAASLLLFRSKRRKTALLCFILALLSKESSAVLCLLIPFFDEEKGRWKRWLPFLASVVVFVALRRWVLGCWAQRDPWESHWISSIYGLFQDLRIALWPVGLRPCYSFSGTVWGAVWRAGVFLGLCALALRSLPVFWFLVCLLPVSNLLPVEALAADRFLYMPLAGVALLLAKLPRAWPAVCILALLLGAKTLEQQSYWQDGFRLDAAAHAAAPEDVCTSVNLSTHYCNWGMLDKAEALLSPALEPGAPPHLRQGALMQMAVIRIRGHRQQEALSYLDEALKGRPGDEELLGLRRIVTSRPRAGS